MMCSACAAELASGSHFCPKCGAKQGAAIPAAPATGLEPEQSVWAGRFSPLAYGHYGLLWILFASAAGFVALKWLSLSEAWMRWVYTAAVLLPAVGLAGSAFWKRLSVRYRLTSHRLFLEEGILSRKISEIELMRVDDLSVTQNLIERLFDVGEVILVTSDATHPRLEIAGIRSPVEVKEQIRTHVQKRRSRTLNVESL
jgi:uncharacterized membrane protein YdbT with pleckstrin-like domain